MTETEREIDLQLAEARDKIKDLELLILRYQFVLVNIFNMTSVVLETPAVDAAKAH